MLVLARKPLETIVLGEGPTKITIVVTRIDDDRAHIGIDAPRDVLILRGELCQEEEEQA